MVIEVKRRKQRADYDEDELQRLGLLEEDDDDEDGDDEEDEDEDNGIRGYSRRDGFVVPNDVVEFEDEDGSTVSRQPSLPSEDEADFEDEDSDESVSANATADEDDDDIQIISAKSNGVEVSVVETSSRRNCDRSSPVRRSARIALFAN